jgi:hypothetical protein
MGCSLIFDLRLLKDTLEGAGRQIGGWLAGYSYTAWFRRMLQLPMAAASGYFRPTIALEPSHHLFDFHSPTLTECSQWLDQRKFALSLEIDFCCPKFGTGF